jgi:hypothetical protein
MRELGIWVAFSYFLSSKDLTYLMYPFNVLLASLRYAKPSSANSVGM